MDKYEYKVRAEEIKQLIAQGEYPDAVEIADTIDWRRVKSVMMLCTISDLYKINRRYEEARDLLLMAYDRRPNSRNICYSLCELSIKLGEYVQAVEYYKEFVQISPGDSDCYVLQYKLYVAQDVSIEERIEVLEKLKQRDYKEKWAYELAYLYHKIGLGTKCVEECDELIMMMGSGRYVTKAMELKMLHEPLTPQQQEKYDHRNDMMRAREQSQEQAAEQPWEDSDSDETEAATLGGNAGAAGDAAEGDAAAHVTGDTQVYEPVRTGGGQRYTEEYVNPADEQETLKREQAELDREQEALNREQEELDREQAEIDREQEALDREQEEQIPAAEPEIDIQVKPVNVGEYDTMNLQAQLAKGMQELMDKDRAAELAHIADPVTRSIVAPMLESDTESLDDPVIEEVDPDDLEPEPEQIQSSEVFFGATGDIAAGEIPAQADHADIAADTAAENATEDASGIAAENVTEDVSGDAAGNETEDVTGQLVMEQMRRGSAGNIRSVILPEPPKEMAHVLSQESDGQISMVLPENNGVQVEKQITGQLSIEDILAEWERVKKENEEKRREEVRQHVLQTTGPMFTEFEEAVRDEILAKTPETPDLPDEDIDENVTGDAFEEIEEIGEPEEAVPEEAESEELETFEEAEEPEDETETEAEAEEPEETIAPEPEEAEAAEESEEAETVEEAAAEEEQEAGEPAEDETAEETAETEPEETESAEETTEPESEETEQAEESEEAEAAEIAEEDTAEENAETEETTEAEPAEADPSEENAEADETAEPQAESDRPKVRTLTREEMELYASFIQSRKAREQIATAIDNISMAAYTGNVIVTGEEGMDTMALARNMMREMQTSDSNFTGKVAKISGHGLNGKDVAETLGQLRSGALIIQHASGMTQETAKTLHDTLQSESMGIVIVLEDNRKAMNRFLRDNEELRPLFTARVDVEAMSNDTLVAFGRKYAHEREYSISALGVLELHHRIEALQTADHAVTAPEVKNIMDEAIRHANRRTPGHFFDILLRKRYDEEDMVILTAKDF